jgi:hypothetical protein
MPVGEELCLQLQERRAFYGKRMRFTRPRSVMPRRLGARQDRTGDAAAGPDRYCLQGTKILPGRQHRHSSPARPRHGGGPGRRSAYISGMDAEFDVEAVLSARAARLQRACSNSGRRALIQLGILLALAGFVMWVIFGALGAAFAVIGAAALLGCYAAGYSHGLRNGAVIDGDVQAFHKEMRDH